MTIVPPLCTRRKAFWLKTAGSVPNLASAWKKPEGSAPAAVFDERQRGRLRSGV